MCGVGTSGAQDADQSSGAVDVDVRTGWLDGRQARIRMWRGSVERTSYIRRAHSALDGDRVVTTKTTISRERTGLGASRRRAVWARCGFPCVNRACSCMYALCGVRRHLRVHAFFVQRTPEPRGAIALASVATHASRVGTYVSRARCLRIRAAAAAAAAAAPALSPRPPSSRAPRYV